MHHIVEVNIDIASYCGDKCLYYFYCGTLREEILAGRKFGGNKIWRNWREFNLADGGKHIFWRELNLAYKQKIEYDKCFFYQKMIYFFANNQDKTKRRKNISISPE